MAIITPNGIAAKSLETYKSELIADYKAIDPDWELDTNSPDGQFVTIVAQKLYDLDQQQILTYTSRDPSQAADQALDDIASHQAVTRSPATFSTMSMQLDGVPGTIVNSGESGIQIKNIISSDIWVLDEDVVLPSRGNFTSLTSGPVTSSGGFVIETPKLGLDSISDVQDFVIGRKVETNESLRQRRQNVVSVPSVGMIDSIISGLYQLDNVFSVNVIENYEEVVVGGQSPNSIRAVVQGGDDNEIAKVIYNKKSLIKTVGATSILYSSDKTTNTETINFDRPGQNDIYIKITVSGSLTLNQEQEIKDTIMGFVNAEKIENRPYSFSFGGFMIGLDVPAAMIYTPVNASLAYIYPLKSDNLYVEGVSVSIDDNSYSSQVVIADNDIAIFSDDKISFDYV